MTFAERLRFNEAVAWAGRVSDGEFDAWEEHADWLAADPANPECYRRAALAIEDGLAQLPEEPVETVVMANDNAADVGSGRTVRWLWAGAAAIAASGLMLFLGNPPPVVISVPAGEQRVVTLEDGSVLALNGGTDVRLDSARRVTLERGEAYVTVRHDESDPFEMVAGGKVIRDVGTVFNAKVAADVVRVQVAEGVVMFDPAAAAVRLDAGQGIALEQGRLRKTQGAATSIGSWRQGRMVYRDAGLGEVAEDLSRMGRSRVTLAPGLRSRRFSGVISLPKRADPDLRDIGRLLGVAAIREKGGWRFEAVPD